ncbi:MAG: hypothetical protein ABSH19_04830 [Opitutales bacterium]|jgi:hypothetical protein
MYERHNEPLLPRREFYLRVARNALLAMAILLVSLAVGMAGYHHFEGQAWIDAFANASMILSGMGPLGNLNTSAGKLFAGCYALFSGVIFLTTIGIFLIPIIHRFLHVFHLGTEQPKTQPKAKS